MSITVVQDASEEARMKRDLMGRNRLLLQKVRRQISYYNPNKLDRKEKRNWFCSYVALFFSCWLFQWICALTVLLCV